MTNKCCKLILGLILSKILTHSTLHVMRCLSCCVWWKARGGLTLPIGYWMVK